MNYYQSMYPQYGQIQNTPQMQQIMATSSIQSGNLISVRNEDEARMYPVAPGNSVTFKDENTSYIYTKTMGFSQLDRPIFERYKLIKEDIPNMATPPEMEVKYVSRDEFTDVLNKISDLQDELIAIKSKSRSETQGGE